MAARLSMLWCSNTVVCAVCLCFLPMDRRCNAQVKIEFGDIEQSPSWFESWAFQGNSETTIKSRWKLEIEAEINKLSSLKLTEDQKEKMRLAGSGDISRFMREVQKVRDATKDKVPDQNNVQEIQRIIEPIQTRVARGLFQEDSLLHKMILQILSPEQRELWKEQQRANDENRMRAFIRIVVAMRDARVPMIASQRDAMSELAWGRVRGLSIPREYQFPVASTAISTLSREQLQTFLDPAQVDLMLQNDESPIFEDFLASLGIKLNGQ